MDIPTFGALLRFAMELEEQHKTDYQAASEKTNDARVKDMLLTLAQQNKKSRSQIEKLYNDSIFSDMDIGVQEPIPGLIRSDYMDENKLLPLKINADFLGMAIHLEERAHKFYLDAALQIKAHRPAAARSLDKLGAEKLERQARLKSLLG